MSCTAPVPVLPVTVWTPVATALAEALLEMIPAEKVPAPSAEPTTTTAPSPIAEASRLMPVLQEAAVNPFRPMMYGNTSGCAGARPCLGGDDNLLKRPRHSSRPASARRSPHPFVWENRLAPLVGIS